VVIKSNSQTQSSHLLLVVIENNKISVNSIVLSDKVEERHSDVTKSNEVLAFHLLAESLLACSVIESVTWLALAVDVVSDFEYSALCLQVIKDLSVHLNLKRVCLLIDWVKTVVKHPS